MNHLKKYKIDDFDDEESEKSVKIKSEFKETTFDHEEEQVKPRFVEPSVSLPIEENSKTFGSMQIIDDDVENFKRRLDISLTNFKADSLKEFVQIKRQMLVEQRTIIESESKKLNAVILSKISEIEALKESLDNTKRELAKQTEIKERTIANIFLKKQQDKCTNDKRNAFSLVFNYYRRKKSLRNVNN